MSRLIADGGQLIDRADHGLSLTVAVRVKTGDLSIEERVELGGVAFEIHVLDANSGKDLHALLTGEDIEEHSPGVELRRSLHAHREHLCERGDTETGSGIETGVGQIRQTYKTDICERSRHCDVVDGRSLSDRE